MREPEKLKFSKEEFHESLCRMCRYPDNPRDSCQILREEGRVCDKCTTIARTICKQTSLANEVLYRGY